MIEEYAGMQVISQQLVGSHNYNLNRPGSDKDYKVYLLPTFDDLYEGRKFVKQVVGEFEDHDYHDIRHLPTLMFHSNINFVEGLFSEEMFVNEKYKKEFDELLGIRDKIARTNLPCLYDACVGMHLQKISNLEKGTSGTVELVEKYGYDTKQAMHAIRCLDFLQRFYETCFNDFKKAMTYEEGSDEQLGLFSVKAGEYSLEEFKAYAEHKLYETKKLRDAYKGFNVDLDTNHDMKRIVKDIVKKGIMEEKTK